MEPANSWFVDVFPLPGGFFRFHVNVFPGISKLNQFKNPYYLNILCIYDISFFFARQLRDGATLSEKGKQKQSCLSIPGVALGEQTFEDGGQNAQVTATYSLTQSNTIKVNSTSRPSFFLC